MNNFPPISVDATRMTMASASDKNPLHHTQKMKKRLAETQTHPGEDIDKVDKPQLKAMFETSAEVLCITLKLSTIRWGSGIFSRGVCSDQNKQWGNQCGR
jgi:hypothetical protein